MKKLNYLFCAFIVIISVFMLSIKPFNLTYAEELNNNEQTQVLENNQTENNEKINTENKEEENKESGNTETDESEKNCCKKIIVMGVGEVYVSPDIAIIKLGVTTSGEDVNTIVTENNRKISEIISALESLNISKENIKTIGYSLFNRYDYTNKENPVTSYEINNTLEIKTENLSDLTNIINKLTEAGANNIHSVVFSLKNKEESYNNALISALENAKNKAKVLCNGCNLNIAKICEESVYLNSAYYDGSLLKATENINTIIENNINISAKVYVEFCGE